MNETQSEILLKDLKELAKKMSTKIALWQHDQMDQDCKAAQRAHEAAIEVLKVYSKRLLINEVFCPGTFKALVDDIENTQEVLLRGINVLSDFCKLLAEEKMKG